jgi:hypothetical protein
MYALLLCLADEKRLEKRGQKERKYFDLEYCFFDMVLLGRVCYGVLVGCFNIAPPLFLPKNYWQTYFFVLLIYLTFSSKQPILSFNWFI